MQEEHQKTKRRWLAILLGASLTLNLLVVGLIAGMALRFHGKSDRSPPSFGPALYRALPDADRKALRERMHQADRGDRQTRQEGFKDLTLALRAVPFDPDALAGIVEQQTALRVHTQQSLGEAWLVVVEKMTDAQRSSYADRLDTYVKRGKWKKRRHD